MSDKTKAMLASYGRVLLGCLVAAYTAVVGADAPWTVDSEEWAKIANALWAAALVTGGNYLRKGETRFGTASKNLGMGGADKLEPPEGKIDPGALVMVPEVHDHQVVTAGDELPEQTDNRPRPEDGEQLPFEVNGDQSEWTGGEMR